MGRKDIKNKAGVYQLINLINGKSYIGSSINIYRRLNEYLNPLYLNRNLKKGESKIIKAFLKYGCINFGIKILEYIELDSSYSSSKTRQLILWPLREREQFHLDLIKPEYNINKVAGSNLGRKFSLIVRTKMSLSKLGRVGNKKGAILSGP